MAEDEKLTGTTTFTRSWCASFTLSTAVAVMRGLVPLSWRIKLDRMRMVH
jgi:hypothetical protein